MSCTIEVTIDRSNSDTQDLNSKASLKIKSRSKSLTFAERLAQKWDTWSNQSNHRKMFLDSLKSICMSIDTPRSLAIYLCFLHNEASQILEFITRPNDYCSFDFKNFANLPPSRLWNSDKMTTTCRYWITRHREKKFLTVTEAAEFSEFVETVTSCCHTFQQRECINALKLDVSDFKDDYLITEMFSKSSFLSEFQRTDLDKLCVTEEAGKPLSCPLEAAKRSFISSEIACMKTSIRLEQILNGPPCGERHEAIVASVRKTISDLLPPVDSIDFTELFGWGPGVTCTLGSAENDSLAKLCEFPVSINETQVSFHQSLVKTARPLLDYWGESCNDGKSDINTFSNTSSLIDEAMFKLLEPSHRGDDFDPSELLPDLKDIDNEECLRKLKIRPSTRAFEPSDIVYCFDEVARLEFVPKNAKTDRAITVEPTGTVMCQKAIGEYLRQSLRQAGVDLSRQEHNQFYAKNAFTEQLATIDLSSASDSITPMLIAQLFPNDWYELLMAHRSNKYRVDEVDYTMVKYGGMGNAIVFPLESLIFFAITKAVTQLERGGGIVSIYGDDIICHQDVFPALKNALTFFGFRINEKKSHFGADCFYESCGEHYFHGVQVTPVYQKEFPSTPEELVRYYNRVFRYSKKDEPDIPFFKGVSETCQSKGNASISLERNIKLNPTRFRSFFETIRRWIPDRGSNLDQLSDDQSDTGFLNFESLVLNGSVGLSPVDQKRSKDEWEAYIYSLWTMSQRCTLDSSNISRDSRLGGYLSPVYFSQVYSLYRSSIRNLGHQVTIPIFEEMHDDILKTIVHDFSCRLGTDPLLAKRFSRRRLQLKDVYSIDVLLSLGTHDLLRLAQNFKQEEDGIVRLKVALKNPKFDFKRRAKR